MSSTALDRSSLLRKLREEVWGNQNIFKKQLDDPGTGQSPVDYFDFGEYLDAIKVIAPTVRIAKFLVREEYRLAIQTFEKQCVKDGVYEGGACIMGQPGIGKSCFIAYAVIERLRKKQPVAVQILPDSNNECYALFTGDGVSLHPGDATEPLRSHEGIWAFSDSSPDVTIPAYAFRVTTPDVQVFQTTSPKPIRWKEWTKQYMITRYIMNVWSNEEIASLAVLSGLDVKRMKDLADKWGPVPRTLLKIMRTNQEPGDDIRSVACEAVPKCRTILHSMQSLDAPVDAGPSLIFFIRQSKVEGSVSRDRYTIYIPTQTIVEILGAAVCGAAESQRQDFFNAMIASPGTRKAAGFIFEMWIHSFLASGHPVECFWHAKSSKTRPDILRLASQTICTNDELGNLTPPFYWRARLGFPGIDGALVDEKCIYAIQITVAFEHNNNVQSGLKKLRELLGEEKAKKLKWRVLFVGNRPEQAEVVSKDFVDKLYMDTSDGDGKKKSKFQAKSKPLPVGWCATSPVDAEIKAVETLKNYAPFESDDDSE